MSDQWTTDETDETLVVDEVIVDTDRGPVVEGEVTPAGDLHARAQADADAAFGGDTDKAENADDEADVVDETSLLAVRVDTALLCYGGMVVRGILAILRKHILPILALLLFTLVVVFLASGPSGKSASPSPVVPVPVPSDIKERLSALEVCVEMGNVS